MRVAAAVSMALVVPLLPSAAQTYEGGRAETFAGSSLESYLRYLQTLGIAREYPISIRSFSLSEIDWIGATTNDHPWADRYSLEARTSARRGWSPIAASFAADINTAFPFGGNDGVAWRGRGLTVAAQAGAAGRYGPVSFVIAPVFFRAQNSAFTLMPAVAGIESPSPFADPIFGDRVDRPQRFGNAPYARIGPGESALRIDAGGLTTGISAASQWWGPSTEFPPILGNNAGGFPHFFAGTSRPGNIGIGSVHTRVVYGYLEQSEYSPVAGSEHFVTFDSSGTRRFMAGIVGLITIRGVPGFEIGGTRFFHSANAQGGITKQRFALPLQGLLKERLRAEVDSSPGGREAVRENQLASVFLRWAPHGSGFDAYVEFAREDHSADWRDLMLEPDHSAMTTVGFRHAWRRRGAIDAIRAEVYSYDPQGGLQQPGPGRAEGGVYIHSILRQGHTLRGQLLGADVGPGSGNAHIISYERFTRSGRMNAYYRRAVARESIVNTSPDGKPVPRSRDTFSTIGTDVTVFTGDLDVTARAALTWNLNRYFLQDRTNGTLGVTLRYPF